MSLSSNKKDVFLTMKRFSLRGRAAKTAPEQTKFYENFPFAVMSAPEASWSGKTYSSMAKAGYAKNAVAYACIKQVASACSTVPVVLEDGNPLKLLFDAPNSGQSMHEFFYSLYAHLMIAGNAYVLVHGDGESVPVSLQVLRPDLVTIKLDEYGAVMGYVYQRKLYRMNDKTRRSSILHVKQFNPLNELYGQSPLEAAMGHVDVFNSATEFNKSLLDNGARLTTALKFQDTLSAEQRDTLRQQFLKAFTGAKNAGRPVFLEGGMDVQELGTSPKDMEFLETSSMAARLTALALGVPPFLIGLPGDNTFNNMKEAKLHFYENTVKPLVEHVLSELNHYMKPFVNASHSVGAEWDRVDALSPLREARWKRISEADFLTTAEKREMLGFKPLSS